MYTLHWKLNTQHSKLYTKHIVNCTLHTAYIQLKNAQHVLLNSALHSAMNTAMHIARPSVLYTAIHTVMHTSMHPETDTILQTAQNTVEEIWCPKAITAGSKVFPNLLSRQLVLSSTYVQIALYSVWCVQYTVYSVSVWSEQCEECTVQIVRWIVCTVYSAQCRV